MMLPPTSYDYRAIYEAYPRKREPRTALRAIEKAIKRLMAGEMEIVNYSAECSPLRIAYDFLLTQTKKFAASPDGKKGEFVPYPATWFNASSYLEDPKEWGYQEPRPAKESRNVAEVLEQAEALRVRTFERLTGKYAARGKA